MTIKLFIKKLFIKRVRSTIIRGRVSAPPRTQFFAFEEISNYCLLVMIDAFYLLYASICFMSVNTDTLVTL